MINWKFLTNMVFFPLLFKKVVSLYFFWKWNLADTTSVIYLLIKYPLLMLDTIGRLCKIVRIFEVRQHLYFLFLFVSSYIFVRTGTFSTKFQKWMINKENAVLGETRQWHPEVNVWNSFDAFLLKVESHQSKTTGKVDEEKDEKTLKWKKQMVSMF